MQLENQAERVRYKKVNDFRLDAASAVSCEKIPFHWT